MRKSIENYVKKCDPCQRRKSTRKLLAPLGEVEEPKFPFEVTSMDVTLPHPMTPRKNKYLFTFIGHFTKYTEVYPIQDQRAKTCARVYATQIITRHVTGPELNTHQGRALYNLSFKKCAKYQGHARHTPQAITHSRMALLKTAPFLTQRSFTLRKFSQHELGYSGCILSHGNLATPHSTTVFSSFSCYMAEK